MSRLHSDLFSLKPSNNEADSQDVDGVDAPDLDSYEYDNVRPHCPSWQNSGDASDTVLIDTDVVNHNQSNRPYSTSMTAVSGDNNHAWTPLEEPDTQHHSRAIGDATIFDTDWVYSLLDTDKSMPNHSFLDTPNPDMALSLGEPSNSYTHITGDNDNNSQNPASSQEVPSLVPVSVDRVATTRSHLPRRKSRYELSRDSQTRPIAIPMPANSDYGLDPMQRWRQSPPETEAASFSAIVRAISNAGDSNSPLGETKRPGSNNSSVRSGFGASSPSVASSRSSKSFSLMSPLQRPTSRISKTQKGTRRNKKEEPRMWMCTFCCDTFQKKHDWTRHEKSLHLNCDEWACAPFGGVVYSEYTKRNHCAYCNALDPTHDHLETHSHNACHGSLEPPDLRTYRRKDHLVQHLRGLHQLETLPNLDDWKILDSNITSRCGFCDEYLESWESRASHLTAHFRAGKTMAEWKGGHGFDPAIAACVRNALPPYVLGAEASSLVPFSATNPGVSDHFSQIVQRHHELLGSEETQALSEAACDNMSPHNERASEPGFELTLTTYVKFLGWHLGKFAQRLALQGEFPTDKMFQDELRLLVYGSADAWERTIADSPEWLAEIRQQYMNDSSSAHFNP